MPIVNATSYHLLGKAVDIPVPSIRNRLFGRLSEENE
jgi:hypothetical protein